MPHCWQPCGHGYLEAGYQFPEIFAKNLLDQIKYGFYCLFKSNSKIKTYFKKHSNKKLLIKKRILKQVHFKWKIRIPSS